MGLFGCGKKKDKKPNLEGWLETNFPGQLVVVGNVVDLDPRNLFTSKTQTILADNGDPDVQIKVTWFKKEEGLGLHQDEVQTMLDDSRRDVKAARSIFGALKGKGLDQISVGVIDMAAYILVYKEPTPELRNQYAAAILDVMTAMPDHAQTSIWIECMEPTAYGEHFKDIVPFGYWRRGDSYHDSNKIMSLDFEWNEELKAEHLLPHWKANHSSSRAMAVTKAAYVEAAAWASKHISGPYYLEPDQMIRVGLDDDDSLSLRYEFPYFETKPDTSDTGFFENALGYVSVAYHMDKKTFSGIKTTGKW